MNGSTPRTSSDNVDVLIIGAGFSGVSALYRVRKLGLTPLVLEAASDFGGVWHWNRYPGARVDSELPFYQLNIPEVYSTWSFSERFPDHTELRKYFAHVDRVLNLRKDVRFNTNVTKASFDESAGRWTIETNTGYTATAKYLIVATGLLHRMYTSQFPGLDKYKGILAHSATWPQDVNYEGKRVAVIGAGATSVQVVQELSKKTANGGSLSMLMRRPSTCLPMQQRNVSEEEQNNWKAFYPVLFQSGRQSAAGFPAKSSGPDIFAVSDEAREARFEELWQRGAFNFTLCNYGNIMVDEKANTVAYDFWAKKVRARISDPAKRDLMAPLKPVYPFATKRTPLEMDYYESLDMPHVEIVDLKSAPIQSFTEKGILTEDGKERPFDIVVMATGFDSFTGSLTNLGLHNTKGVDIKDLWKDGVKTYLGTFMHGFPNAFSVYSPQAPNSLTNGPTIIECQCDLAAEVIRRMEAEKAKSIEPTVEAEEDWKAFVNSIMKGTLYEKTDSWWNGSNIPGKKVEALTYAGGVDQFEKICYEKLEGWKGFTIKS